MESTTEDLLADLDRNVASKAVQLRDVLSGQVLSFVVTLRRGGFFGSLCGTADGVWPRRWEIDPGEAARAAQGALVLEIGATADPSTLANALDVPAHVVRDVVLRPPADQADLAQVEQREQAPLPAALRDLLTISDGMLVHELAILGTQDTYLVDFGDGRPWWLVGQSRDGTHYVCGPEYVASIPEPRADPESMVRVATSYRDWVRDRLLKYA